MKETYDHKVMTSFYLWFDHTLLQKGRAFKNHSSSFYYNYDERMDGLFVPYSSPFKQWVSDSSVDGAIVPSGVSGDAGFMSRGQSGLKLDFENGRVLFESAMSDSLQISGGYSIKDFNIYMPEDNEQDVLFAKLYSLNSRYGNVEPSGVPPYDFVLPAAFIMQNNTKNEPYAFGGEQDSQSKIRVVLMTDIGWDLDGCISLFRDLADSNITLLSSDKFPIDEYGDLKSGSYNYLDLINQNQERLVFLDEVKASKIVNVSERRNSPNIKYGIIDFYLSEPRVPKQDL